MKTRPIKTILIANRGEIAVRIIRTCKELDIRAVAVFSDPDRSALHVQYADEAYRLPGARASETYLNGDLILSIAEKAKVDAIHPGYGFLSENPEFAGHVASKGMAFIGPSADAIRQLGDKTAARAIARRLKIPTVAGSIDALKTEEEAIKTAAEIGFPVLLKAAAGGGGKGMRFNQAYQMAKSEALKAFADDRIYVEKYVENPRHVEIQILADHLGNVVYLGERDCSIQRRHQKVIEESPSLAIDDRTRRAMGDAAVRLAKEAGYTNAGTVEFLVDGKKKFHFLEVNTRLQVEHPITEVLTGIDIVREQIRIAEGKPLTMRQEGIHRFGHALECRIYAEDPENNFLPSTGVLTHYSTPTGPRTRIDNGAQQGDEVQVYYDPMLSKVITWGETRSDAIESMKRALREFRIHGIQTTIPFCLFTLEHQVFTQGEHSTSFVQQYFSSANLRSTLKPSDRLVTAIAAALFVRKKPATDHLKDGNKSGKGQSSWKARRIENQR
jgi:propionyl-CoA carboxylase alpha chain